MWNEQITFLLVLPFKPTLTSLYILSVSLLRPSSFWSFLVLQIERCFGKDFSSFRGAAGNLLRWYPEPRRQRENEKAREERRREQPGALIETSLSFAVRSEFVVRATRSDRRLSTCV